MKTTEKIMSLIFILIFSLTELFAQNVSAPGESTTCNEKIFIENGGVVAVEAEDFVSQTLTNNREWFIIDGSTTNTPRPDPDDSSNHAATASGGKLIELLPDTRVRHADPIGPESFQPRGGRAAIINYRINFSTTGKYFVWVRAHSTGSEDNGIHVGIDGTWPGSGERMQWCAGKRRWTWESKQRTNANHCGEPERIFINVDTPGIHTVSFSMREDGFEMDKFVLNKVYERPINEGPAVQQQVCNDSGNSGGDEFFIVNRRTGLRLRPQSAANGASLIQVAETQTNNFVRWERVDTTGDFFFLRNVETGMYFRPASNADGAALEQRPTSFSGSRTQWRQVASSGEFFYLENRASGLYFRPVTTAVNSEMIQRPTTFSGNFTQWTFESTTSSKNIFNDTLNPITATPNPVSNTGILNINLPNNASNTNITVLDISGKYVYSQALNGSSNINMGNLNINSGLYLLKIDAENTSKIIKLLVD